MIRTPLWNLFRRSVKHVTPPILVESYRRLNQVRQNYTWEGIYQHMRDVPTVNASYGYSERVREMSVQAAGFLADMRAGQIACLWHDFLASVAATTSASSGKLRVLDFGGAVGSGFIQLCTVLPKATTLEYHVVDLPEMCAAGRILFADEPRIYFHTAVANVIDKPDIVYVSSVLQYIEDYAERLRTLAAVGARWLILARVATGNIPTYATRQLNLPGQVLPYWFLNRDELVNLLQHGGYRLAHEGLADREYDQSNFPETHRIGRMRNLLFVRE